MKKKNASAAVNAELKAALLAEATPTLDSPGLTAARAFLRGDAKATAVAALDPDTLATLIEVLVDRGDADRLRAIESLPGAPHVARAVGRGLHLLRTRGVAVAPPEPRAASWHVAAEPLPDARLGLDFMYDVQWLTLFRRDEAGEGVAIVATIDGEGALCSLEAIHTSRGRYRDLAQSVAPRDAFATEIGADDAYGRLLDAAATHERLGRPHLESTAILKKLPPLSGDARKPTPHAASPLPTFDRDVFAAFTEQPKLRTWVPDEATLRPFVEAIRDAQTSLVAINQRQIASQIQAVVARMAGQYFSADRVATHARRFVDLAGEFGRRNEAELHDVALSLSHALAADGFDATTHPYTLWFFGRLVPAITAEHPARIARGVEPDGHDARHADPSAEPHLASPQGKIILP